jgi:diguanylate cyclase (GGDEF)-like protein
MGVDPRATGLATARARVPTILRLEREMGQGGSMGEDKLMLYRALSRAPFPNSYLGKVFLVAFLGTHVPLLALLAYLVRFRRFGPRASLRILSVTVPATLGGTAATLWAIHALSAPVGVASRALRRYLDKGELPDLPTGYTDRAGRLMADVQYAIERLDAAMGSLDELASRDHLTGLHNRRAAEEHLAEDVARAGRGGGTPELALLDLDDLKAVNDAHGHHAGDACLIRFAEALGRNAREGDWVARWGGDEFLVVTWHAEEEEEEEVTSVERVLGRVAEDLREDPVVLPDGEEALLNFSGGVCRWRPGDDPGRLLSKADVALYRAKAEGGASMVRAD